MTTIRMPLSSALKFRPAPLLPCRQAEAAVRETLRRNCESAKRSESAKRKGQHVYGEPRKARTGPSWIPGLLIERSGFRVFAPFRVFALPSASLPDRGAECHSLQLDSSLINYCCERETGFPGHPDDAADPRAG